MTLSWLLEFTCVNSYPRNPGATRQQTTPVADMLRNRLCFPIFTVNYQQFRMLRTRAATERKILVVTYRGIHRGIAPQS